MASQRSCRRSTSTAETSILCREHRRSGEEGERGEVGGGALGEGWAVGGEERGNTRVR